MDMSNTHCLPSAVDGLANDIQSILGDALTTAITMFPHTPRTKPGKGTLPRHLWPKSVKYDVSNIRRRAKLIRRLIALALKAQGYTSQEKLSKDPSLPLQASVNKPLTLRTVLNPAPKDMASLGVLPLTDPTPMDTSTLQAAHACFKGLRKATRLLFHHARNLCRLRYSKVLPHIFVKKPSAALKAILRNSEGAHDNTTLPTDLSVLRDETSGRLLTTSTEVIAQLEKLETKALSPHPTLPPGAPFPWLDHVRPTPTSSVPMLIGQITPAIC